MDHCVCVDAQRGLVYDSEEQFPVHLTPETLAMCGGGGADCLNVVEIRQVVFSSKNVTQ